ncbi:MULTISPECIES: DDE-type integrase/transposase/recombinase [Rhodobacterales]|nr:MAG: hypothetical protein CBB97_20945 [Candidatus Endolissoclinum sp. TMED37]
MWMRPAYALAEMARRGIDANGPLVDYRLTARRGTNAAKALLRKTILRVGLHRPASICTDGTPTYRKGIRDEKGVDSGRGQDRITRP